MRVSGNILDRKGSLKLYSKSVIKLLSDIGQKLKFDVRTECNTGLGSIDLIWFTKIDHPNNTKYMLPVVGFEIETSNRTRKHLKGDILNLINLSCSLGVIVLVERGFDRTKGKARKDFEGNKRAIEKYVKSLAGVANLQVWTASDVEKLFNKIFETNQRYFNQQFF